MGTNKVLIVGVVRNCAQYLNDQVLILSNAFQRFSEIQWLLIESDSSDETRELLGALKNKIPSFNFKAMGSLEPLMKSRTQRIAYCRNQYLKSIRESQEYADIEYVVVADFDGVNRLLSSQAVDSCWSHEGWAVCAANQEGPYYDIWALRHEVWSPGDCWAQYHFLINHGLPQDASRFAAVYSKMIKVPQNSTWLKVQSAFGGLAIYRKDALQGGAYIGLDKFGSEVCEHVSLHEEITRSGFGIYINPSLINADFIDHTELFRPKPIVN
ncbi:hypothetical protein FD961_00710 [Polynucleobacter sp. TSB-Sco08W16]|uniref:hypothetical protein n=1 Tax=Polynucleobacter sp. TSB-Sco08W16 TaxID=1758374 RepID=UPI001BFE53F5|nr:hypothetical protein [Polynucleobacter sp. TSB-Sco08W16]QWD74389.1 hypothetical protein FD961_00710 [Polynucleobacter sp. TSB-Sco08W16]